MNNHFKIIIPFFNVEQWARKCVLSVKLQNYKNYQCVLVDDMSTDNSVNAIKEIIGDDKRFTLIQNTQKKYALQNIYEAIQYSDPKNEDIIVTLDGDDWLFNRDVLKKLNQVYENNNCWITYGSYAEYPSKSRGKFSRKISEQIIYQNSFRENEWTSSHLRSFKYFLWSNIDKQDLLDSNKEFYRMAWDLSFMFPMLEMAGDRSHFIEDMLYVYNLSNPINDHKIDNRLQIKTENTIRLKNKYKRLKR
tara:strand:+ start:129 stop:872 length:744 start_codon:yes stop_codon:yes gene_type:complete